MYTITLDSAGIDLEERVRRVAARRYRERRPLPQYFLAPDLAGEPPVRIDGFLVLGTRLLRPGQLCAVVETRPGRTLVRFERGAKEVRHGA